MTDARFGRRRISLSRFTRGSPQIPEVEHCRSIAEVKKAFARYERALVSNDVAELDALFSQSPRTLRYGATEKTCTAVTRSPRLSGPPASSEHRPRPDQDGRHDLRAGLRHRRDVEVQAQEHNLDRTAEPGVSAQDRSQAGRSSPPTSALCLRPEPSPGGQAIQREPQQAATRMGPFRICLNLLSFIFPRLRTFHSVTAGFFKRRKKCSWSQADASLGSNALAYFVLTRARPPQVDPANKKLISRHSVFRRKSPSTRV